MQWVSAARVRAVSIDLGVVQVSIGALIDAEEEGASRYRNEIRYGDKVVDFDPGLVSAMSVLLAKWAKQNWSRIRYVP